MKSKGGSSQDRRRARRAAERETVVATVDAPLETEADAAPDTDPVEVDPGETLGAEMAAEFADLGARARGETRRTAAARRRAARTELVAAGAAAPPLLTTYETTQGSDADRFFTNAVINAGYVDLDADRWPIDLARLDESAGVVLRDGDGEAVLRLGDGTLVHASASWGWMRLRVAAPKPDGIPDVFASFRSRYPASYISDADSDIVPITFWMNSSHGPIPRLRRIDSASWGDVEQNYSADVRDELARLMAWKRPGSDGQLLLWQGPPGTGKTWALRALASEWASWAEFHYITDPDQFFVHDSSYMVNVLLADSYDAIDAGGDVYSETDDGGKWRVLILEDTGELLAANAKESYGQGLSRLLNVVDGMIGQGLRVLALVTTNDELGDLHPAVQRPGRCASAITFGPLTRDESNLWLADRPSDGGSVAALGRDSDGATLAELYAIAAAETAEAFEGETAEPAASMPCDDCDHTYAMHPDGAACSMEDCECMGYAEPVEEMPDEEPSGDEPPGSRTASAASIEIRLRPEASDRILELWRAGDADPATFRLELTDLELVRTADGAPAVSPSAPLEIPSDPASGGAIRWRAVLCPEGIPTDDGRIFAPGAISWRPLPLTLMGLVETSALGGHDKAQIAGRIDSIYRDGSLIRAEGVFDEGEFGGMIAELVDDEKLRGVSVDLAVSQVEMMYRSDVLDADGLWIGERPVGEAEVDPWEVAVDGREEELFLVVWEAKIGMATVCPFQAFEPATIEVATALSAGAAANPIFWRFSHEGRWSTSFRASAGLAAAARASEELRVGLAEIPPEKRGAAAAFLEGPLLASAAEAPVAPPAEWFEDPELSGPTPLTVTDDGRIYGHAAVWDSCHMSYADVCVAPPTSPSGYACFHLGDLELGDGTVIPVGKITMDTGHAPRTLSRVPAARHYDDTGTVVAHIVAGEDDHGIWFSGGLIPGLSDERLRLLRGSCLSGDWRDANGLELVALLAVNVPGFPVPRPRAMVAAGERGKRVVALTAAGVLLAGDEPPAFSPALRAQFDAIREIADGEWADLRDRAKRATS